MNPRPPPYLRADPRLRVAVFAAILLIVAIGFAALVHTQSFIAEVTDLARTSPERAAAKAAGAVSVMAIILAIVTIAAALYLGRLGLRTWRHAAFPPPGTWVIRDTRVLTGGAARALGMALLIVAGVLLGLGVALPIAVSRLSERLEATPAAVDESRAALPHAPTFRRGDA